MKKSIYITASILILGPISINATTLTDCQTKCGTTTNQTCPCDSNGKTICKETTDCSHNAYRTENLCKKANPGKTCSRASNTYRTLTCYACESDEVKNLNISTTSTDAQCGTGGPTSDERGYRSYSTTCTADNLGSITVSCFLPD